MSYEPELSGEVKIYGVYVALTVGLGIALFVVNEIRPYKLKENEALRNVFQECAAITLKDSFPKEAKPIITVDWQDPDYQVSMLYNLPSLQVRMKAGPIDAEEREKGALSPAQ